MTDRSGPPERASALMLMPALILVVLVLAAIAVDHSMLHATRRHLHQMVDGAADDAAGVYSQRANAELGSVEVDCRAARALVARRIAEQPVPGALAPPTVEVTCLNGGRDVTVRATVRVDHVIGRALPGGHAAVTITAEGHGRLVLS